MVKWEYKRVLHERKAITEKRFLAGEVEVDYYWQVGGYDKDISITTVLNDLGEEGWELVSVSSFEQGYTTIIGDGGAGYSETTTYIHYFKREK